MDQNGTLSVFDMGVRLKGEKGVHSVFFFVLHRLERFQHSIVLFKHKKIYTQKKEHLMWKGRVGHDAMDFRNNHKAVDRNGGQSQFGASDKSGRNVFI